MKKKIKVTPIYPLPESFSNFELNEVSVDKIFNGHRLGIIVGTVYPGEIYKSYIQKDNEDCELFKKLLESYPLVKKGRHIPEDDKLVKVEDYFISYEVEGHVSTLPTAVNSYVTGCDNVMYDVSYEVLFVDEREFKFYLKLDYMTKGNGSISFFDTISRLEDNLIDLIKENNQDFIKGNANDGLSKKGMSFPFYDNVGEKLYIYVNSIEELLARVASIRVVSMKQTILK